MIETELGNLCTEIPSTDVSSRKNALKTIRGRLKSKRLLEQCIREDRLRELSIEKVQESTELVKERIRFGNKSTRIVLERTQLKKKRYEDDYREKRLQKNAPFS